MRPDISLRPAAPADEDFLRRLYAGTRTEELALTGWDDHRIEAFLTQQWRAQTTDYERNYPAANHDIVIVDGAHAGRLWVDRRIGHIHVLDISLLPERRGAGIGSELLGRLQIEARQSRCTLGHSVLHENTGAIRLYRRLGFEVADDLGMHYVMQWDPRAEAD